MFIDVNQFSDRTSDSDMIQAAVDLARETGQAVVIPKKNRRTHRDIWEIDKTIVLYSESTIILQNCHLRMADGAICNMFASLYARTPMAMEAENIQRNITIRGVGKAILDGGKHNGLYEVNGIARNVSKYPEHSASENCMIFMQNVEHLLIENITIKDQRYWAICLYTTSYSRVANIHFSSSSNVPNQDGVDLLKGCHDIIVENITGCVGDNIVALLATDDEVYERVVKSEREGDIHNVIVRNLLVYGVGGCSLIRLLNHDGFRIYNVRIENVIEVSPWSDQDASVAQNPDLVICSDREGNIVHTRHLTPGEEGYRCESAIIIGESYWYNTSKAKPGDTFGISVSNVMTHARFGIFLNNTLQDSSFENIRMFGNGFTAVFFGEGQMENLRFQNISYDKDCRPLTDVEHIRVDWNHTSSDGFHCIYFNGTYVENIRFRDMYCGQGMDAVFGGHGSGNVVCENVQHEKIPCLNVSRGIEVTEK